MRAWTKRKNSLETYVILSAAGVAGRAKKPSLVGHNSIFPGSRKKGHWAGPHIRYPSVLLANSTGSLVPLSRRGEAVRGLLNAGLKSEVADPRPHPTGTPIFGEFGSQIPSARTPREPLHRSVRHIALIVGTWSRLSSSGSTGEQQSGAPDASSGDGMIIPKPS